MTNKKYYEIKKSYLAMGMNFLGFPFLKFGYGADTTYGFEDTKEFQIALKKFIELKSQLK